MNIYKNPFAIRASERIETDEMFLELFSSEPLTHLEEKFEQDKLWNNVTTILSSPGAGKTTLLRLFSPTILQRITERNTAYKKLKRLEVIDSERIKKCGVYLQLGRDYEFLEDDILFNEIEQKRLFLSLLNARIVLATLKSLMALAGIKYTQLNEITYTPEVDVILFLVEPTDYIGAGEKHIIEQLSKQNTPEKNCWIGPQSRNVKYVNFLIVL